MTYPYRFDNEIDISLTDRNIAHDFLARSLQHVPLIVPTVGDEKKRVSKLVRSINRFVKELKDGVYSSGYGIGEILGTSMDGLYVVYLTPGRGRARMEPFRIVEDLLSRKTDVMQERYDLAVEEQLDSQEINFHKINLKESLAQLTILRTYVN